MTSRLRIFPSKKELPYFIKKAVQPMDFLYKYLKAFQLGIQSAMEYRADFILSLCSGGFIILIQCFLWTAVFDSSPHPVVYGYTFPQMIAYSIMAGLVAKIVAAGFQWEIVADIKNGGLNKFIVQPMSYFLYRICCFLG
jgi:ABC-2 type transport system permease protein